MSPATPSGPAALSLRPLTGDARDGRYQLVFSAGEYAVARWGGEDWRYSNGAPLGFTPTHYRPSTQPETARETA